MRIGVARVMGMAEPRGGGLVDGGILRTAVLGVEGGEIVSMLHPAMTGGLPFRPPGRPPLSRPLATSWRLDRGARNVVPGTCPENTQER